MEGKIIIIDGSPALRKVRGPSADCYKYIVSFVSLILLFVVACEREVVVPQFLIGKWKTSAPNYADRYLKSSEYTLIYGVGEGKEVSHTIDKIDSKSVDGEIGYIFYYRDAEGEKAKLTFTYRPDLGGTLQLKNSQDIWQKDQGGDA
jgi:hypothetical protein